MIEDSDGLSVDHVDFANITNFAVLVSHSKNVLIDHVSVKDSGSLNAKGRNNTTGGILLEEGSESVHRNRFGVPQHPRQRRSGPTRVIMSPRNSRGKIADNQFFDIGRDAIQVGHATQVGVAGNRGSRIGMPVDLVDVENGGTPVGIDTAGNVDQSAYEHNSSTRSTANASTWMASMTAPCAAIPAPIAGRPRIIRYGNFGIVDQ